MKNIETQINRLWDAFHNFDYDAYREIKKTVNLKDPQVAAVIKRIESHPTFGKSRTEHDTWAAMRDKQEAEASQRELEYDALHGLHHKHANVFFGKTVLDSEYKKVCDRLGIVPAISNPDMGRIVPRDKDIVQIVKRPGRKGIEIIRKRGSEFIDENPAGERRGEYVHYPVKDKRFFDERSFRTITLSPERGIKATTGCRKGQWMPRKKRCREGTKIQKYLYPPGIKPSSLRENPIPPLIPPLAYGALTLFYLTHNPKNPRVLIENPTKEKIQAIADHFQCPVVRIRRARKNPILYGEGGDIGNMILRDKQITLEELLGKEGVEKEKREFEETVKKSQSDPGKQADLDRQEREYKMMLEQQKELERQTKHSKQRPDTFRVEQVIMRKKPVAKINSPEDVVRLMKHMEDHDREFAEILHLDTKNQVVGIENISSGSINANIVHPREAVKGAVLNNSTHVIFVHNHPSGNPEPSREDLEITKRLKESFNILGIDLLDSMIIGKDGHYSMKEAGTL